MPGALQQRLALAARLLAAWRGRTLWLTLAQRHRLEDGAYLVAFIEDDPELNRVALDHVADLRADRRARGIVIVTDQTWVADHADPDAEEILAVERLTTRDLDHLLSYYELYNFSPRVMFVSLTRPNDNRLFRMVGVNGITLDDLVCLAMYRIRGWDGSAVPSG